MPSSASSVQGEPGNPRVPEHITLPGRGVTYIMLWNKTIRTPRHHSRSWKLKDYLEQLCYLLGAVKMSFVVSFTAYTRPRLR